MTKSATKEESIPKTEALTKPSPEALQAEVRKEAEDRMRRCSMAVQQVCAQHKCAIVAQPIITQDGRLDAKPMIVSQ